MRFYDNLGESASENSNDIPRLNKHRIEKIFGGIWIEGKEEFAKFVSAVNNYAFEENGQGIAYTDDYFYAYYINIDGQVIPYAAVKLTAEQSQEVVNRVNKEIENVTKGERAQFYFDRAYARARNAKGQNNADNGNNNGAPSSRSNGGLVRGILRKGAYFDNPSLYVKAQRADRFGIINRTGNGEVTNSARRRAQMADRVRQLAEKLHLDNVEVVTESNRLHGNKKGIYSKSTGKITIIIPNHSSVADVEQTLLHEAVAHYGLRSVIGDKMDELLDVAYNGLSANAKSVINNRVVCSLLDGKPMDKRVAMEEYLSNLAKNGFKGNERLWGEVKDVFGGKADNLTISVKTQDGNERKVVMRQGNETGAGAKH